MKREKELLLDEIRGQIANANSFVITQYDKLTANKANEFRRELQKVKAHFEVVRKRVFFKAAERVGLQFDTDEMNGHIGIILVTEDPIEVAKTIIRYSSENENSVALKGGYVDGKALSSQEMTRLSTLPGKDQLRAELLGLFEAPLAETLSVMDALLTSVLHCVGNRMANE